MYHFRASTLPLLLANTSNQKIYSENACPKAFGMPDRDATQRNVMKTTFLDTPRLPKYLGLAN